AKLAQRFDNEVVNDGLIEKEKFALIPKKTRFINTAIKGISRSQKYIKCVSSLKRYSQALNYSFEALKAALERGVLNQTIIDEPKGGHIPQNLRFLMEYPNFEIKFLSDIPEALGSCVDDHHVGILVEPNNDVKDSDMLLSMHPSLIAIFNEYFTNLWKTATDLKKGL
ncbi:MAG: hypothetical protein P8Y18_09865, partial [Candidatus Bathyarchaeota archaeon]